MSIGRVHKTGATGGAYCKQGGGVGGGEQLHLLSVGVKQEGQIVIL